jgi:hypothetical protein
MKGRFVHTSMVRITDLHAEPFEVDTRPREGWASGDYAVVELTSPTGPWTAELTSGRMIGLEEGDLLLGALGIRHATLEATGSWEAVGEDGMMHLLTGGGLLGKVTSHSVQVPTPPEVRYVGHVIRDGRKVVMRDFVRPPEGARPFEIPTVMIIGTSMSAGKTQSARIMIRRLQSMGLRVMGAKLTGAGRYRDVLTMGDSGARPIYDFVDAGLPSTVCPVEEYREALDGLLSRMAEAPVDVAVIEAGASPLEPYNGTTVLERLAPAVRMTVLCASDPYAVVGLRTAFGADADLITGIASNTLAGVELVQRLSDSPCMDIRQRGTLPELDRLLRRRLGLDGADRT